jgi:hypothetical protein
MIHPESDETTRVQLRGNEPGVKPLDRRGSGDVGYVALVDVTAQHLAAALLRDPLASTPASDAGNDLPLPP